MVEVKRRKREVKPRQYASENKRPTISFRVRADTFEKLKASAKEHDLSLSEEVERCVNFKFSFARDTHDELVMQTIRNSFAMAEQVAGSRWFESKEAAKLCNAAVVGAAYLLMVGIGPGDQESLNPEAGNTGAVIGGAALNDALGRASPESRQRYEAAVAAYKDEDRRRYLIVKALLGELPEVDPESPSTELALRLLTPEAVAAVRTDDDPEPVEAEVISAEKPAPKRRARKLLIE